MGPVALGTVAPRESVSGRFASTGVVALSQGSALLTNPSQDTNKLLFDGLYTAVVRMSLAAT